LALALELHTEVAVTVTVPLVMAVTMPVVELMVAAPVPFVSVQNTLLLVAQPGDTDATICKFPEGTDMTLIPPIPLAETPETVTI
jgi:hypothetical protein